MIRQANINDLLTYFNWANDTEVRKNSFSQNVISMEEHEKWFKDALSDENTLLYVLTEDNKDIGQVRVKIRGDYGEISYSVDKDYRHKGYGTKLIQEIEKLVNVKYLVADVKLNNIVSQKVFIRNNYTMLILPNRIVFKKEIRWGHI